MKNDVHPIEAALLVVLLVVEALATLLAALVAVLALLQCCRQATPAPAPAPTAPPPPTPHPLQSLSLAPAGTVAQLRHRARAAGLPPTLARNGRRDALLSALAGLEVALI